jgi:hypothetical protein
MPRATLTILVSLFFIAGCLPRSAMLHPAATFSVRDLDFQPIAGAKIFVVVASMPHAVFHHSTVLQTDHAGLASISEQRKWEVIMPLIIHGTPAYYAIWCAEAPGYPAATERLPSLGTDALIEIALQRAAPPSTCDQALARWGLLRPAGGARSMRDHIEPSSNSTVETDARKSSARRSL